MGDEFYADADGIRRAIRHRSSVNVIHQPSAIKVDLFIAGGSPVDEQQIARRKRVQVSANPDRYLFVHTPEDILLQKLHLQEAALSPPALRCALTWASTSKSFQISA